MNVQIPADDASENIIRLRPIRKIVSKTWVTTVVLLMILLLGASFRFMRLTTWDGGTGQHPDERFFLEVTTSARVPTSWNAYFDSARSPGNPRNVGKSFFVYGTFPVLLTRTVAVLLTPTDVLPETYNVTTALDGTTEQLPNPELDIPRFPFLEAIFNPAGHNLTDYYQVHKVGRTLVVLFDIGSLVLIFLIGQQLYGRRVGLLAALLAAMTVMSIQQSHFYVDPIFSTFFTLLALYGAVRVVQKGDTAAYVLVGISIGFAMANRITLAALGLVAIVAALESARVSRRSPTFVAFLNFFVLRSLPLLFLAGFLCLLVFRIVQPSAFIGSLPDGPVLSESLGWMHGWGFFDVRFDPRFLDNMRSVQQMVTGEFDFPPSLQWVGRTDYLFPFRNMVLWGMGPALGAAAWLGWLVMGWRLVQGERCGGAARPSTLAAVPGAVVLWVWVAFYFAWQGSQFASTMRYMLPIYGALIIAAAWLLVALWDRGMQAREPRPLSEAEAQARLWQRSRQWVGRWLLAHGHWVLVIVVVATLAWAYAFTRIYTRPHSRVMAAQWVLDHVPPGAYITTEEWDDPLPLQVGGMNPWGITYLGVSTSPYAEDEPQKFLAPESGLLDQLEQADYIVLTSNRIYRSIPRLPMRYPATIRYYHYLFTGELGFELVADITSYPTLFGVPIPDQKAEEAFTVYDHPRVLIFEKTKEFSRERAQALITDDVNWNEVYKLPVGVADRTETALRLTDGEWPLYEQKPLFRGWQTHGLAEALMPLVWLVTLEVVGLATFALLFRLLPWLPDRGWSLARIVGLLLVAYGAWLLGSFKVLPFTTMSVWLCALPLLVGGAWVGWRARGDLLAFWRARRGALLTAQAIYLVAFVGLLLVRWLNPDLWHPVRGGEKPMDFAYLHAVLQSVAFPAYDPWFAGGYINYYYFGFVLVGALVHMTGVALNVAYNLAVPTLFALTAVGAWGVVYNLLAPAHRGAVGKEGEPESNHERQHATGGRSHWWRIAERRAWVSALLAPLLVLLTGNLAQALWYLNGYADGQQHRPEWAFWDATRIVKDTINEFPFFTFLFADLHAHMIVMPFSLAMLGMMVALARMSTGWTLAARGLSGTPGFLRSWFSVRRVALLLLLGLLAGTLRATNTWDYPTYVGLMLATLMLAVRDAGRRLPEGASLLSRLVVWALSVAGVLAVERLLFLPFTNHFVSESTGVQWVYADQVTPLTDWLRINGLWLFVVGSAGAVLAYQYIHSHVLRGTWIEWLLLGVCLVAAVLLLWFILHDMFPSVPRLTPLRVVLLVLVLAVSWLLWEQHDRSLRMVLPLLWAGMALAINFGIEMVLVRGDVGRMNTVFKFGLHSWVLFGLTAAVALPWLWRKTALRWQTLQSERMGSLTVAVAVVWRGLALLFVGAALVYPLTATPARIGDRYGADVPRTLDGTAFMQYVDGHEEGQSFPLREDAEGIAWLKQHADGVGVVLEAHQPSYRWAGRVATFTGLPTLMGWEWHQVQQRSAVQAGPIIQSRRETVAEIYNSADPSKALQLIRHYGVEYVYVGGVEQALYTSQGLAKFETLAQQGHLASVFQSGSTQIYAVAEPGVPTMLTTDLSVEPPHMKTVPPLLLDEPVGSLPPVAGYAWNEWASGNSLVALVVWLMVLYGLALLGLPLALLLFGGWRDGGVVWARLLALLVTGYVVWLPTSLGIWHSTLWSLGIGVVLVLALNVVVVAFLGRWSLRRGVRVIGAHLQTHRRTILISEGLFLVGLLFFVVLRALNPDLWHPFWGGEKPMEVGFLNAILRSPVMPPYDPFFSDGYINYYYYGFFLLSLLIKATGIATPLAYNLVIPTVFALTLVGGYAIVAHLTGRVRYGLAGAAFLVLLGNLASPLTVGWSRGLQPVLEALSSGPPAEFGERLGDWYVGPSRIIPFTINEFPFWSFLFADLHPHMIALPMTLLVIALAYQLVVWGSARMSGRYAVLLIATALTLGALSVTNSWDFPTYGLLVGAAMGGAAWRSARGHLWSRLTALVQAGLLAVLVGLASLALYMPFFDHYHAFVSGVGVVSESSAVRDYVVLYGLFLAVVLPMMAGVVWRLYQSRMRGAGARDGAAGRRLLLLVALGIVLLTLVGLRVWLGALIVLGVGVLVLGTRERMRLRSATWFTLLLAVIGWVVSLVMEVAFIRDHLATGEWYRMNTVFKFGVQVWTLLALAAAASLPHVVRGLSTIPRAMYLTVLTVLVATAALFPLIGIPSRLANRFDTSLPPTLDGLAFMQHAQFTYDCVNLGGCEPGVNQVSIDLGPDRDAIAWLNNTIVGTPIVVQADKWFYRAYGIRVASNTGLPTIVSPLHASEQHDPSVTADRSQDVDTLFRTQDTETALRLLATYGVQYIYVGPVERAFYSEVALEKFETMVGRYLERVYDQRGVAIYEVMNIPPVYAQPVPAQFPQATENIPLVTIQDEEGIAELRDREEQVAADPTNPVLAYGLAERYRDLNRLDDAARVLEVAAESNPGDVALHHLWGDILTAAGRHSEAEGAYLQAAQAQPTAGNWNKLGMALLVQGELDRAESIFRIALTADAEAPDPYYGLGMMYSQQGKQQEAIEALETYLRLAPDGSLSGEARQLLDELDTSSGSRR